jgi:hypothetical protein
MSIGYSVKSYFSFLPRRSEHKQRNTGQNVFYIWYESMYMFCCMRHRSHLAVSAIHWKEVHHLWAWTNKHVLSCDKWLHMGYGLVIGFDTKSSDLQMITQFTSMHYYYTSSCLVPCWLHHHRHVATFRAQVMGALSARRLSVHCFVVGQQENTALWLLCT